MNSFRPFSRVASAMLLPGILILMGCGGTGKPTGTVTGTVKYKGSPVSSGTVNFHDPTKGKAYQGVLDGSGNFTLKDPVEVGTYKVYINPPIPEQLPPGTALKKAPPFNLPPKYQDPGQTPISREVKTGPNNITIDVE